jgi:Response regulators consisting of a CheY-like receiver domain and a winged-helix DNA-binding domain
MKHILFVEDNEQYRQTLTEVLENKGYSVDAVSNAMQAIQHFATNDYDLVISDLMMENISGLEFLRHIKTEAPLMKTMILTAQPSDDTELEALDIYVDKYLSKETRMDIIIRYVETLLEQDAKLNQIAKNKVYTVKAEGLIVDVASFKVTKNDVPITLTTKEFNILVMLLSKRGKAISRDDFLDELWDMRYETTDSRVVDMHIKAIRRKLQTQSILSIRGYGYKWE